MGNQVSPVMAVVVAWFGTFRRLVVRCYRKPKMLLDFLKVDTGTSALDFQPAERAADGKSRERPHENDEQRG